MLMDSKINLPSSMRSLVLPFFSSAALHNFLMLLRKQHHLGLVRVLLLTFYAFHAYHLGHSMHATKMSDLWEV